MDDAAADGRPLADRDLVAEHDPAGLTLDRLAALVDRLRAAGVPGTVPVMGEAQPGRRLRAGGMDRLVTVAVYPRAGTYPVPPRPPGAG